MGGTLLATAMIAVTIQLCTLVFSGIVESPLEGLLLGTSVSLSSLSVVLDYLRLHGLTQSTPSQVMTGMLGFQGFLVGIFFSIPPALTGGESRGTLDVVGSLTISLLSALCIAVSALGASHFVIPHVSLPSNPEVYLLCVVSIAMFLSLITNYLGLSLDLGAFFAGLMFSEFDAGSKRTKELIHPLSSVFGALLFASLGMMLNAGFFWKNMGEIFFIALQLILIKLAVIWAVVRLFNFSFRTSIFCAVGLCHVGELSLLFSSKLRAYDLLSRRAYLLFLAATCVTLTLAPFFLRVLAKTHLTDVIYKDESTTSPTTTRKDDEEALTEQMTWRRKFLM